MATTLLEGLVSSVRWLETSFLSRFFERPAHACW